MNKNIIIGTAGHIDHGKTTLIKALTGSDTDRLQEEKKRGISIDLGFTNFKINQNKYAGIIDVPGHEKFLKNMLAGVSGMDLVLLVVSAEEGVMPQTREHLDILNLIGLEKGIIVITKIDKVEQALLEIVKEDIENEVMGTFLENSDIVCVDSISKKGITELIDKIDVMTDEFHEKNIVISPRLFVDRAFSVKGFGTVVTGTLIEGTLRLEDEIFLYPDKIPVRVRGIQVHSNNAQEAFAGQRVALNLSNLTLSQVKRGDILSGSGQLPISMMIDTKLTILPSASKNLEHWDRVRVYHGAREIIGRAVPLNDVVLKKGDSGYVQIRLEEKLTSIDMDHLIIRFYSPMETIGGGIVIDSDPDKHGSNSKGIIDKLRIREDGDIKDKIEHILLENKLLLSTNEIFPIAGCTEELSKETIQNLLIEKKVVDINNRFIHQKNIDEIFIKTQKNIVNFHKKFPYRKGINKEELRGKISKELKPKDFELILQKFSEMEEIDFIDNMVRLKSHEIIYNGKALEIKKSIEAHYKNNYSPSSTNQIINNDPLRTEIFNSLVGQSLIFINEDLTYDSTVFNELKTKIMSFIEKEGKISIKDFKEISGLSRKYMIAIFEYLDQQKLTRRSEDFRIKF